MPPYLVSFRIFKTLFLFPTGTLGFWWNNIIFPQSYGPTQGHCSSVLASRPRVLGHSVSYTHSSEWNFGSLPLCLFVMKNLSVRISLFPLLGVCVCMWYACSYMCVRACVGVVLRLMLKVLLYLLFSLPHSLWQGLSVKPRAWH